MGADDSVHRVHLGRRVVVRPPLAVNLPEFAPTHRLLALILFGWRVVVRMRAIGLARTAASLSFTTVLALVPFTTVALAFVTQFPAFEQWLDTLQRFLLRHLLPGTAEAVVQRYLLEWSENAVGLTGISIAFVAATAAMATATIEREINLIWGIRRARPLARRLVIYAVGLTLGPVLLGASLSVTTWLVTQSLAALPVNKPFTTSFLKVLPFVFTTAGLALLYAGVPARRVSGRHALIGAAAAAMAFEVAKHGFAFYLSQVPTYRLVYGALAVLPVFLIWIYLCWMIVLVGAAITATLEEPLSPLAAFERSKLHV
jgi:membrane protein